MKYSVSITILLFISTMAIGADSRTERLKIRLKELNEITTSYESNTELQSLIISEIKKTENFLSTIKKMKSLGNREKKYSIHEIELKTDKISKPLISLYVFSKLVQNLRNTTSINKLTQQIDDHINNLPHGAAFKATKKELINMSKQYMFEKAITDKETIHKKLALPVLRKVELELSKQNYSTNDINLNKLISKKTFETLEANFISKESKPNVEYLMVTPQWKLMENRFLKNKAHSELLGKVNKKI